MKNSKVASAIFFRRVYKCKVQPTKESLPFLQQVNATLVDLWNLALEQCFRWIEKKEKFITPISLNFWLTGIRKDEKFSSVSVILQREVLRRMAGSFSSFFALKKRGDEKAQPPRQRTVDDFITLTWVTKSFTITGESIVASIGQRIQVKFTIEGTYVSETLKNLPQGGSVVQVTISKRDGEYWANFVCNIPRPEPVTPKEAIAIDLGSGDITFACSDGREFSLPARRPDKFWMKHITTVEERASKCVKGSRAWKRRMKARRFMHNKSKNQHTDHQRKLANWIIGLGMTVVVGKMKTRLGLAQSGTKEQNRGVQCTGYAMRLLIFLKEKSAEHGIHVLEFPDPKREGSIDDPSAKFSAARKLLALGCEHLKISYPTNFERKDLLFPQG